MAYGGGLGIDTAGILSQNCLGAAMKNKGNE